MELNYQQTLFVNAYIGEANGNATEAARIAGYAHPNTQGPRLLGNVGVRAKIAAHLDQAAMPANEVLARLTEFASGDLGAFLKIDDKGKWSVDLKQAKKYEKLRLLKKVKATRYGDEIEIHSPVEALDKLARVHGLYKDKVTVNDARSAEDTQALRDKFNEADSEPGAPGEAPSMDKPAGE